MSHHFRSKYQSVATDMTSFDLFSKQIEGRKKIVLAHFTTRQDGKLYVV